jgi:hypothetical protein
MRKIIFCILIISILALSGCTDRSQPKIVYPPKYTIQNGQAVFDIHNSNSWGTTGDLVYITCDEALSLWTKDRFPNIQDYSLISRTENRFPGNGWGARAGVQTDYVINVKYNNESHVWKISIWKGETGASDFYTRITSAIEDSKYDLINNRNIIG